MSTDIAQEDAAHHLRRTLAVQRTSVALAGVALGIGLIGLAGWIFSIPHLKSIVPGLSTMKANTASCVSVGSLTLLLLRDGTTRWRRWAGASLAVMLVAVSVLTLTEYAFGASIGIDNLLFVDTDASQLHPGRMGVNTAICVACIGMALLLINASGMWTWLFQFFAASVFSITSAVVISYPYEATGLTRLVSSTQMAIHTAVALLALSVAVLASRPRRSIVAMLISAGTGALLLRRLWPQAWLFLVLLGWLEMSGVRLGLYGQGFGTALLVLAAMTVISVLVWRAAGRLDALDAARADADSARQRAQRRVEELLHAERHAREEAERANRLKDEFLATLSHELRTPLNAVLGWTLIARRTGQSMEKVHSALDIVDRNAQAQSRLVDDLLDVSRIIAGRMSLHIEPVDPARVIDMVIATLRPAAIAKGLELDWSHGATYITLAGDRDRLQQVAWNLLSNAIKFTPRGGRVAVRVDATGDSRVSITVTDTGEGIPSDSLPYVFNRFWQADGSATRQHGGLGLGLSIVRHLVELHGGEVQASSPGVGLGSTFVVSLPVSRTQPTTIGSRFAESRRA